MIKALYAVTSSFEKDSRVRRGRAAQGSGIGIMRKDRRTLQLAVSNLERKLPRNSWAG